jgi:hypothetical protein
MIWETVLQVAALAAIGYGLWTIVHVPEPKKKESGSSNAHTV